MSDNIEKPAAYARTSDISSLLGINATKEGSPQRAHED